MYRVTRVLTGAGLTAVFLCLSPMSGLAQAALDVSAFDRACVRNGGMLVGQMSPDADRETALRPLCDCISDQLSRFSQADVDMLVGDLNGTATDLDRAAFGDYDDLVSRARNVVIACFADPALLSTPTAP